MRLTVVIAISICATLLAAQTSKKQDPEEIGNRDVGKGVNFYSIEKEIALGKELAAQFAKASSIVDDPQVAEYINRLVQNLARNSDAKVPFTAKVVDAEEVNALSLPGGFLFVNTGLILRSDSEAELAGGLAHEIAHIAARHGTRQATRGQIANVATIPLIFLGGWAGVGVRQAAGMLTPMGILAFDRGTEAEADTLGLQYMYKAGYDPAAFVDFWEKMQAAEKRKPGTISKLFATHPPSGERVIAAQKNIQEFLKPKSEYVVNTSEFDAVQRRIYALQNRRGRDGKGLPTLRKAPGAGPSEIEEKKDGDRPTLKRRPLTERLAED
ncbi:MAG: M48 family metallopeptidase [Bryobacteraceae bacterium]